MWLLLGQMFYYHAKVDPSSMVFTAVALSGPDEIYSWQRSIETAQIKSVNVLTLLLGPKAPSLKMGSVFFFRLGVADFALWTLIGSRHLCCLLITC